MGHCHSGQDGWHHRWHGFIHRRHRGFGFNPAFEEETEGRMRRRRVFDAAELRLLLLKLLSDQPRHGYDLIRAVEELTGGGYSPSPGIVYPTLTMLSEMGHIREDLAEGSRKTYSVTPDGAAFLEARKTEVAALMARLAEMANERARFDRMPVRRAMMNLRAVLMHRLGGEAADTELLHAITAIIDEAAQRIERL